MNQTIINVPNQVVAEFLATVVTLKVITNAELDIIKTDELHSVYRLTAANTKDMLRIKSRLLTVISDIESDYAPYGI